MAALQTAMKSYALPGVNFGLKGGLELTNMSFSSDALDKSNRTGFFIGPTMKVSVPLAGLGVDISALYHQRELKVETETMNQKSIIIPVNARMSFGLGSLASAFVAVGPQFSFNLGDDSKKWLQETREMTLRTSTMSLNFGAGVTLIKHLEAAVSYNLPLGKTGELSWTTPATAVTNAVKTKVGGWRFGITYYF